MAGALIKMSTCTIIFMHAMVTCSHHTKMYARLRALATASGTCLKSLQSHNYNKEAHSNDRTGQFPGVLLETTICI